MPVSQKLIESASIITPSSCITPNSSGSDMSEESKVGASILRASLEGGTLLRSTRLPVAMPYIPHRQPLGISKLVAATFLAILGGFMIAGASGTGWLKIDILVLGGLGILGALAFCLSAWRDLFGRLELNEEGILATPFWSGFRVNWSELDSWKVNKVRMRGETSYQLLLWTRDHSCPLMFPAEWVSSENQSFLLTILESKIPHRAFAR